MQAYSGYAIFSTAVELLDKGLNHNILKIGKHPLKKNYLRNKASFSRLVAMVTSVRISSKAPEHDD